MKIIAFSDLHLSNQYPYNEDGGRLDEQLSILDRVYDKAVEHEAKAVIFGGDLTNKPSYIETELVRPVERWVNKLGEKDIELFYITGNHDHRERDIARVNDNYHSTTDFLRKFGNVVCIDNQLFRINSHLVLTGVPFYRRPEDLEERMDARVKYMEGSLDKGDKIITLLHNIPDIVENPNIPVDFSIKHPLVQRSDLTLCGHAHRPRAAGNFFVMGNPTHRNWNDADQSKFIYLIDTGGDEITCRGIQTDHLGRRFCIDSKPRKTWPDIYEREINKSVKEASGATKAWTKMIEDKSYDKMLEDYADKEQLSERRKKIGLQILAG